MMPSFPYRDMNGDTDREEKERGREREEKERRNKGGTVRKF